MLSFFFCDDESQESTFKERLSLKKIDQWKSTAARCRMRCDTGTRITISVAQVAVMSQSRATRCSTHKRRKSLLVTVPDSSRSCSTFPELRHLRMQLLGGARCDTLLRPQHRRPQRTSTRLRTILVWEAHYHTSTRPPPHRLPVDAHCFLGPQSNSASTTKDIHTTTQTIAVVTVLCPHFHN
jgi:hypothetical protein